MPDQSQSRTDATGTPDVGKQTAARPRVAVPAWVTIAGLVLVLVVAALIIVEIGSPLAELVLGNDPDVPVPDGAKLEGEWENQGSAQHEWLYNTDQIGCEVALFYAGQEANCVFAPFACGSEGQRPGLEGAGHIATCRKTEKGAVTGYSWEVNISSGYPEGPLTRFRIWLFN